MFIHRILQSSFQRITPCQLCGLDLQESHSLCRDCWSELPWFKQSIERNEREILVALHYVFPIDRIIQKYKYEQQLHYQTFLFNTLIQLRYKKFQAIVPMPISAERLASRGYNQMLIIAKLLAKHLNVEVWQPVIRSAQHAQKGLSRVERLENIEQQFKPIHSERRKFKKVLIIDDVVTTGSSVHALALALERLGCNQIQIACVAAAVS